MLAVTMKEDTETLDEVVVVAYGTQSKRNVTGSMETVKMDKLAELPVGQFSQKYRDKYLEYKLVKDLVNQGKVLMFVFVEQLLFLQLLLRCMLLMVSL